MITDKLILTTRQAIQGLHSNLVSLITSESSYAEGKAEKAVKTAKLFIELIESDSDSLLAQLVMITKTIDSQSMSLMEWIGDLNEEALIMFRREARLFQPILDDGDLTLEVY